MLESVERVYKKLFCLLKTEFEFWKVGILEGWKAGMLEGWKELTAAFSFPPY